MAESIIGLRKTELVRNKRPWPGLDDLELAPLEWDDWFNRRRVFKDHGRFPPAEVEALHSVTNPQTTRPKVTPTSLHGTLDGTLG